MPLLAGKTAVIYGAGGAVGGAVARAFARDGARVVVTGRTQEQVDTLAREISSAGGSCESGVVDALDENAVKAHLQDIVMRHGRVDISMNLISPGHVIGEPMSDISVEELVASLGNVIRTNFVTGRAAARHMAEHGSGVVLALTASPARRPLENQGSFGIAGAAIEALCRQLAVDFGARGVRVVCLRSAGSPDAPDVDRAMHHLAKLEGVTREDFEARIANRTMLKHLPRLEEIANLAVVAASDYAAAMTGTVANGTCGEVAD